MSSEDFHLTLSLCPSPSLSGFTAAAVHVIMLMFYLSMSGVGNVMSGGFQTVFVAAALTAEASTLQPRYDQTFESHDALVFTKEHS